jgi:uncharacterized DUF497 family protein
LRRSRFRQQVSFSVNPFAALLSNLDKEYNCPYTDCMKYEWDPAKAEANLAAHGVSFTEAVTVLEDDFALTREDPASAGEQRFVTLGMSGFANLLVVVYTYREPDVIRIISAWRANRRQRVRYEKDRR